MKVKQGIIFAEVIFARFLKTFDRNAFWRVKHIFVYVCRSFPNPQNANQPEKK